MARIADHGPRVKRQTRNFLTELVRPAGQVTMCGVGEASTARQASEPSQPSIRRSGVVRPPARLGGGGASSAPAPGVPGRRGEGGRPDLPVLEWQVLAVVPGPPAVETPERRTAAVR